MSLIDELECLIIRICRVDDLPVGLGRAFDVGGKRLALFLTRRGTVHAVDNTCPHRQGPLAEGMLAGNQVVCPLHAFRFDLASGECDQPGTCAVHVYPTEIRDDWVYLTLDTK